MKYFLLFLLISFSIYPQISKNIIEEESSSQVFTSCAPKIKAVELNFIKEKSEVRLGSEADFFLEI